MGFFDKLAETAFRKSLDGSDIYFRTESSVKGELSETLHADKSSLTITSG